MPLTFQANKLRQTVLRMAHLGSTAHVACAFSLIEILAVLYRSHLNVGTNGPKSAERDYLILSKGHGVMAQYACLYELGWIGDEQIVNYCKDRTHLKGLADAHVPGVEVTAGSLGHGLSVGLGLALAAKRKGTGQTCYIIVGDGEINEGAVWEGLLFANHFELNNVIVILDANGYQAMGSTDEVMKLGNIAEKLRAFGFETRAVDGHNEEALDVTLRELKVITKPCPRAIVAHTIKGKGVSFMENENRWHYTRVTPDVYKSAFAEL
jgi:transketolase